MPTQIQGIEFEVVGSGAEEAAKSLDDLAASLKKIKSAASSGLGTSKATKDISALRIMLNDAKKALTSVGQGALKAGKSILAMPFKSVADRVKSLNGRFSTLLSSLKRIAFYRIIRTIIKEVGQALKEGIKNLYGWSTLVNGQFKTSMDTISTSMLYLKNSIGAAVAPIINALAPAIDFLIDKVVALINVINQLFARLSGAMFWTRAKKKATDFGEAVGGAGDAAKEAIHYLAPFDELNVLPDNKDHGGGGGGGADFSDMFEEVTEFSDEIKNFADAIKKAIRDGDWQGLGTLLGEKINELIGRIDFAGFGAKIGEKINAWFTTKYWTLETINFHTIGQNIATFLNNMLGRIDFDTLGRSIVQPFTNFGDFIIGALETVNWNQVGSSIKDFITGAFKQMGDFLDKYDWTEVGMKLFDGLNDFISGLDPLQVLSGIVEFAGKLASALYQIIQGFLLGNKTFIDDSGVEWKFDVNGRLVKIEDKVPKTQKEIKGLNGKLDALEDELSDSDKSLDITGKITGARDATHGSTSIAAVAEIVEAYDSTLVKPFIGAIAALQRWEKAKGFDSTISNMVANFMTWSASAGFGRQVGDMIAVFTKWKKDNPTAFNTMTDMVASFKSHMKANGFPNTIQGIVAGFASWIKEDPTRFSKITEMVAQFKTWAKGNGFSDTISGFTAALSSYLKQFNDPTINAIAEILEAYPSLYMDEPQISAIADFVDWLKSFNSPELSAIADVIDAHIPPDMVAYIPGVVDPTAGYAYIDPGAQQQIEDVWGEYSYANGGVFNGGFWNDIPQFASGGVSHGSMFVAGEDGAELVGHIGGRTEVLNRSQIASTMYASMNSALRSYEPSEDGVSEDTMYRAFRRALDETDFGGDIELDGDTLYSAMVNRNNRNTRMTGVNAFA